MYEVVVESANKVWIGIHQEDERGVSAAPYVDAAIIVLRAVGDGTYTFHDASGGAPDRHVCIIFFSTGGT